MVYGADMQLQSEYSTVQSDYGTVQCSAVRYGTVLM
jgi:hypothetical protein